MKMEKLTGEALLSIDAIRQKKQSCKEELCNAFANTVFLADLTGNITGEVNKDVKDSVWQIIKTLAYYSNLIDSFCKKE